MASKSYSPALPAKKKATPAKKKPRRRIALTPVTKEEEKGVNEVLKPKQNQLQTKSKTNSKTKTKTRTKTRTYESKTKTKKTYPSACHNR